MKRFTILIVTLLLSNLGYSQSSVGIKAGYTNSGLSNLEEDGEIGEIKRASGLLLGIMGQFGINEKLSVVGELNFQQKGVLQESSFEFFGITTEYEAKTIINYLEIPVLLRFTTGENLKFYGNVGPYLGYALGGRAKAETTIDGVTEKIDGKIKFEDEPENYMGDDVYVSDEFNRLELGVYVGAGIQKAVGTGSLILDARFGIGLTDTNNLENEPEDYEPNKFNNFTISIGYAIPLGGE